MVIGTAQELVAPAVALLQGAGLPHEVAIEEGDPVQGMLELIESEGCDMVIIGAHPHSLLATGSTRSSALRLAKVAPVPVLSVRAPAPPEPDDGAP
jgi:nucleotide-binding universal stress UspA family protein